MTELITTGPEIEAALTERRPVVALESTLITHGLPFPENLRCARNAQSFQHLDRCGQVEK